MCGLEVHQQLATHGKLFCRCPAGQHSERVDATVLRHMRPTLSELGEYDGCALMEFRTRKEIVYLLDRSTVCTYEIDDTPPFELDEQAVKYSLEISALFGLARVSELQVMRKQYLDGSIPTGFQRTAMVGLGGRIPFRESELGPGRELTIRQLTLEEDSCREVSDVGHRIVFRTDRLGTPLIETVTEPELLTPNDVRTGGRLLARVARSSGKVRRGAGAARQDVNVSIAGSRRVEIKGVDHHRRLPELVHNEAFRHLNLLRVRAALRDRGVKPGMLELKELEPPWGSPGVADVRSVFKAGAPMPIQDALEQGGMVAAVRLPGFAGLLAHRTQPGVTFGEEIVDRLRVVACLSGRPFMFHSDDHAGALSEASLRECKRAVGARAGDTVVVVWGETQDVATAVEEVLGRAGEALVGVPSETRQAHHDCTTGFERILPGPERMYPDTDTPPFPVPDRWLEIMDAQLAERPWDREDRYIEGGLGRELAWRLVGAPWADLFDALAPKTVVGRRRLALALEHRVVHWWRQSGTRDLPPASRLRPLVDALDEGRIRADAYETVFDALVRYAGDDPAALVAPYLEAASAVELAEAVAAVVADAARMRFSSEPARLRWATGQVMYRLRGRVDPNAAQQAVAQAFGAAHEEAK